MCQCTCERILMLTHFFKQSSSPKHFSSIPRLREFAILARRCWYVILLMLMVEAKCKFCSLRLLCWRGLEGESLVKKRLGKPSRKWRGLGVGGDTSATLLPNLCSHPNAHVVDIRWSVDHPCSDKHADGASLRDVASCRRVVLPLRVGYQLCRSKCSEVANSIEEGTWRPRPSGEFISTWDVGEGEAWKGESLAVCDPPTI